MLRTASISQVCQRTSPSKPFSPIRCCGTEAYEMLPLPRWLLLVHSVTWLCLLVPSNHVFHLAHPLCRTFTDRAFFGSLLLIWWYELVPTSPIWLHQGYHTVFAPSGPCSEVAASSVSAPAQAEPLGPPPFTQEGLSDTDYFLSSC